MVQLLKRGEMQRSDMGQQVKLKVKVEDNLEGEEGHLNKRSKHSPSSQDGGIGLGGQLVDPESAAATVQYNPLDEPSPLGLRLRKSPSLLELIQMKLYQGKSSPKGLNHGHVKKESKGGSSGASGSVEKLKASNFPATVLKIGSWEYTSRYEGDLVAKCYFAKHKLVWEVLDGGLKNKIEIQWSDISALRANYPDDGLGTLDVVLSRPPVFFRETNPQPRKHTLWQATSDFTKGQASLQRHHFLQCPQGVLGKHFEKLIQCDHRLNFLSQQAEINLDSPFFEPRLPLFDDPTGSKARFDMNKTGPGLFHLSDAPSPSGGQCSSSRNETDSIGWTRESVRNDTPSPSSVTDPRAIEEMRSYIGEPWKELSNWDQIKVPGLHTSMSMSDLVCHLENRVSEQQKSSSPNNVVLSTEERQGLEILDEISRCLLSDSQFAVASDEKSLMSRVNSLCCLLQKDPQQPLSPSSSKNNYNQNQKVIVPESTVVPTSAFAAKAGSSKAIEYVGEEEEVDMDREDEEEDEGDDFLELRQKQSTSMMSRKDSVGELLLNLPRIASLPHFLFNTGEEGHNQAH